MSIEIHMKVDCPLRNETKEFSAVALAYTLTLIKPNADSATKKNTVNVRKIWLANFIATLL